MKTKRFLATLLATATLFSLAACGEKKDDDTLATGGDQQLEQPIESPDVETGDVETEPTPEAVKPSENPVESKPTAKPQEKPSATPSVAPSETPTATPTPESTSTPTPTPEQKPATVGRTLLNAFNSKASSDVSTLADALITNPIIPFAGAVMPVEPGLLSGFGNAEITGFKEGAMFGPMIGSVAFIGYVFELEEGTNKSDFISTLKSNADLRWNICVEADEMVVGSSGNKVFFVMCPKEFSEE